MEVFKIKTQSVLLPVRQNPCARWMFIALVTFNFLSFSLFLKNNSSKLIAHFVVQDDTTVVTYKIPNDSFLSATNYLFIVRSQKNKLEFRNVLRKSWYSWRTSINAKLLFIIESSSNTGKYAIQDLQFNDIIWTRKSGQRSIESVRFLEVVPTAHYYIISLDTTFINFDNVVHFLQRQGKGILFSFHSVSAFYFDNQK